MLLLKSWRNTLFYLTKICLRFWIYQHLTEVHKYAKQHEKEESCDKCAVANIHEHANKQSLHAHIHEHIHEHPFQKNTYR